MAVPSPSLLPNHLSGDWIMFRFIMTRAIGTIAMLVAPAMCALAQSSGRIVGRVTDTQGAGVAGVQLITSPSGV
jgi:hypothetical protein